LEPPESGTTASDQTALVQVDSAVSSADSLSILRTVLEKPQPYQTFGGRDD